MTYSNAISSCSSITADQDRTHQRVQNKSNGASTAPNPSRDHSHAAVSQGSSARNVSICQSSTTTRPRTTLRQLQKVCRYIELKSGRYVEVFCGLCNVNTLRGGQEYFAGYLGLWSHLGVSHKMSKKDAERNNAIGTRELSLPEVDRILSGIKAIPMRVTTAQPPVGKKKSCCQATVVDQDDEEVTPAVQKARLQKREHSVEFGGTECDDRPLPAQKRQHRKPFKSAH